MVTIKDVAREANVSVATVSRVLNGSGPVSDETRRRIREVASRMRYVPHSGARSLITRPALLFADEPTGQLDHATARHLLDLLERKLKDLDTAVIIATHDAFVAGRMKSQWQMEHGVLRAAR